MLFNDQNTNSSASSISPDNGYLAVSRTCGVDVYHLISGTPVSSYPAGTQETVPPVLFIGKGKLLVAGVSEGGSHLFDTTTGLEVQHLGLIAGSQVQCVSVRE